MPCPRAGSREEFPAYEQRFAHLDSEEQKDFREQFGDTWDLVATMTTSNSAQATDTQSALAIHNPPPSVAITWRSTSRRSIFVSTACG